MGLLFELGDERACPLQRVDDYEVAIATILEVVKFPFVVNLLPLFRPRTEYRHCFSHQKTGRRMFFEGFEAFSGKT